MVILIGAVWCDPLNRLEFKAFWNPLYFSGFCSLVRLPSTASVQDVIQASGQFGKAPRIVEVRNQYSGGKYVWVQSEKG
jgi:hypothetical protein